MSSEERGGAALGEIRYVESRSNPGHMYPMVWAPVSGWVHADDTCPAFKECWHRKAALMTSLVVRQSDGAIIDRPVLLVEYDAAAISKGVDPSVAAKWAYDLPVSGQPNAKGVGVRGVEEGLRLLASHGEIIRVDAPMLAHQDDREAFFVATASRYVVTPDGAEVRLDSQSRGKRVSKWEEHSASYKRDHPQESHEYFNKNWFEVGIAKAARNAALALMPSNVKTALLKAGLDAAGEMQRRLVQARPPQESRRQDKAGSVEYRPEPPVTQEQPQPTAPVQGAATQSFDARAKAQAVLAALKDTFPADIYHVVTATVQQRWPETAAAGKFYPTRVAEASATALLAYLEACERYSTATPPEGEQEGLAL